MPRAATDDAVIAALRKVFRPLARLLIARSLPYPFVSNLLREAYVAVAVEAFPVEGKPQTDSRVTLLTRVHRVRGEPRAGSDRAWAWEARSAFP